MLRSKTCGVIGISYNTKTGDASNESLLALFKSLQQPYVEIDHFHIAPEDNDLEKMYTDHTHLMSIFRYAKQKARMYLEQVNGLILPGNRFMVDPRLYGEKLELADKLRINLSRAISELSLIHIAIERGMPILAICGGHQILNVYLGGKLSPIPEEDILGQGYLEYSSVKFLAKSEIANIFGFTKFNHIGSFFGAHQFLVSELGGTKMVMNDDLLTISAKAIDSTENIEATEQKYGAPIYSVQFHPEVGVMGMYSVFYKDIRYHAANEKDVQRNASLLHAFLKAAESYKSKKCITPFALSQTQMPLKEINVTAHKKNKSSPTKSTCYSLQSLFNEAASITTPEANPSPDKSPCNHV